MSMYFTMNKHRWCFTTTKKKKKPPASWSSDFLVLASPQESSNPADSFPTNLVFPSLSCHLVYWPLNLCIWQGVTFQALDPFLLLLPFLSVARFSVLIRLPSHFTAQTVQSCRVSLFECGNSGMWQPKLKNECPVSTSPVQFVSRLTPKTLLYQLKTP